MREPRLHQENVFDIHVKMNNPFHKKVEPRERERERERDREREREGE